ncbi:cell wall anchor protein [Carnobacterium divergens]|nr:cell wall anchor protein [Carnobacterium divergens]TFJ51958.1 cell wall anchor protein [Carnobacterium divergens]
MFVSNLKKKIAFLCIIFIGVLSLIPQVNASQLKFSVEPIIPENQNDLSKTYFDLRVKPEEKQVLKVHMRNDTDKEVTVEPSVHAATTNINGVVEYGESNTKLNKTSQYNIEEIVKPAVKEVTIPANGATDLELTVEVPKDGFNGILAGGITLKEKDTHEEKKKQEGQGLAIENKYAYVVAVVLNESETQVDSELTLEKVAPNQVNARNVINATLQNTKPKYMNQLSIDSKVTKKGDKEVLYASKKEGMQMAPNTSFDYPVSLNGEKLKAGDYTLSMTAKSMGETWKFKKDFTIKAEVAKAFNEKDVTVKKDYTWLYILIGSLLILIAIFLIWFIIRKKKKEKQKREEQRKKEQRRRNAKRKRNAQKMKQQERNQ